MTKNEVAIFAATLLQADDLADIIKKNNTVTDKDALTLLLSVDLAIYEMNGDFPVHRRESVSAESGRIPFSELADEPWSIVSVKSDGKYVGFKTDSDGIIVGDGTFEVEYTVSSPIVNNEIKAGAFATTELFAYLSARNYCLITGRADEASIWDQRYNMEAEKRRIRRRARLPARAWR